MTDLNAPAQAHDWENKATRPAASDIGETYGEFLHAFEAFKETNDQRLDDIERRMSADVVTTDKLDRINRALDDYKGTVDQLLLKAARPQRGGGAPRGGAVSEHKNAFEDYMRRGEARHLRRLEEKALSAGSGSDGGYLVPEEIEAGVMRALRDASPIRAISGVRQVSGNVYKKPFAITGAATGWVAETGTRAQTNSPTLSELAFPTMELTPCRPRPRPCSKTPPSTSTNGSPKRSASPSPNRKTRLSFPVTAPTSRKVSSAIRRSPRRAGPGTRSAISTTGVSADFPASDPADKLIDLIYTLKSAYRANAQWVMNRSTQAEIRKIKDGDGNYIWRPGDQAGQGATLMTFPIAETEDMPAMARTAVGGVRRFRPRLSGGRPAGVRSCAIRSRQALCAVLHNQARRRRRAGFRCDQAVEVRHRLKPSAGGMNR